MNQHCKYCDRPRKPRTDRPGKFFTVCVDHYREYQRQKNRESYYRHQQRRIEDSQRYRDENPGRIKERSDIYYSDPENRERRRKYMETYRRPYRAFIKDACERCGWVAENKCQLDGHHKDGNHDNNDPANIETLCPPCHRLV